MNNVLEGIRVLDFTHAMFGAANTQLLGDLGADVIKIEPLEGDLSRMSATPDVDSTLFLSMNRNKRSLVLNLKDPEGLDIALKMAKQADVVAENFRPGAMDKLGLGYEAISKINPRVIYSSQSMYGEDGPLARRRGADVWAQGFTGLVAHQGSPGGAPYLCGASIMDTGGAMTGALTIIAALFMRERTGIGQKVTTNLVSVGCFIQTDNIAYMLADGVNLKKVGRGTGGRFPYGPYPAKDGDIVTMFGQDNDEWATICSMLGIEYLLEDERYDTTRKRVERMFELYPILDEAFREKTKQEWVDLFRQNNLRCDPCLDYEELINHPQFQANDLTVEVDHPVRGKIKTVGPPMKFKGSPPSKADRHPPVLGEHSSEMLRELGYSEEKIQQLSEQGVIGIPIPSMLQRRDVKEGRRFRTSVGKGKDSK